MLYLSRPIDDAIIQSSFNLNGIDNCGFLEDAENKASLSYPSGLLIKLNFSLLLLAIEGPMCARIHAVPIEDTIIVHTVCSDLRIISLSFESV
jgi:hypothetical protein